jgi:hypothetical protein
VILIFYVDDGLPCCDLYCGRGLYSVHGGIGGNLDACVSYVVPSPCRDDFDVSSSSRVCGTLIVSAQLKKSKMCFYHLYYRFLCCLRPCVYVSDGDDSHVFDLDRRYPRLRCFLIGGDVGGD